ncbi:hypothetical protein [Photobacterium minamisatsumaniensis]|uniref:hypothetical protein n=1 Tax=Photobacterium minamisatsumaniensis TaxID=2910233 RepID=UPI003D10B116
MKRWGLFFMLLTLTGCSSGVNVEIPDEYYQSSSKSMGYLTGSLAVTTVWPSTGEGLETTLFLRKQGQKEPIILTNSTSPSHYQTEIIKGHIFSIELPTGHYELYSIKFRGSNGIKKVNSKTNDNLDIHFTIVDNNVTYLGQFLTSSLIAKSPLWNTQYPSGLGMIEHSNEGRRDKLLLNKYYPKLKGIPYSQEVIEGINNNKILATAVDL